MCSQIPEVYFLHWFYEAPRPHLRTFCLPLLHFFYCIIVQVPVFQDLTYWYLSFEDLLQCHNVCEVLLLFFIRSLAQFCFYQSRQCTFLCRYQVGLKALHSQFLFCCIIPSASLLRFLRCNFSFFIGRWYLILFTCSIRLGPSWLIVRSLPFSSPNLLSLLPYWPLSCTVFSFSLSNCSALFIKPSASLLILLLLPALIFIFLGLGLASFISVVLQLWHEQQVASKSSSIIFLPLLLSLRHLLHYPLHL